MGDPHERKFPVYLPPGYSADRAKPYPVVYLLAGYSSKGAKYTFDDSAFGTPLPKRLDEMIESGRMPAVIAVFPDCTSKLGHSQYVNSPALGNYMDYLCDELTTLIDQKYHTHQSADFRGLLGHSSGGFGALVTAMLKPKVFSYICSSAGDSYFDLSLKPLCLTAAREIESAGGVEKFLEMFFSHPSPGNLGGKKFETMMVLAMAACYAPNLKVPKIFGDLFFDLKTAAIKEDVWKRYLEWDPVHMIDRHAEALRNLKWLHLEAGLSDEHGLQFGHRQIAEKLTRLGISFQMNEYPGGHSGHNYRFAERIKLMLEKMKL